MRGFHLTRLTQSASHSHIEQGHVELEGVGSTRSVHTYRRVVPRVNPLMIAFKGGVPVPASRFDPNRDRGRKRPDRRATPGVLPWVAGTGQHHVIIASIEWSVAGKRSIDDRHSRRISRTPHEFSHQPVPHQAGNSRCDQRTGRHLTAGQLGGRSGSAVRGARAQARLQHRGRSDVSHGKGVTRRGCR